MDKGTAVVFLIKFRVLIKYFLFNKILIFYLN